MIFQQQCKIGHIILNFECALRNEDPIDLTQFLTITVQHLEIHGEQTRLVDENLVFNCEMALFCQSKIIKNYHISSSWLEKAEQKSTTV